jgi:crossover junction endodeoxyribonuclease RuvC
MTKLATNLLSQTVLGLDISLCGTGVVVVDMTNTILSRSLVTSSPMPDRFKRFHGIIDSIFSDIRKYSPSLIVIEGYAYGARGQAVFDIAELSGIIKKKLWDLKLNFVEVPPTSVKKFICGKGSAKKELMLQQVLKKYGEEFSDSNLCDAYCLARVGVELLQKTEKALSLSIKSR